MYVFLVILYKFCYAVKRRKIWIFWRRVLFKGGFLQDHANLEIAWTLASWSDFIIFCYAFYDVIVLHG
jgi:hypothetical protein